MSTDNKATARLLAASRMADLRMNDTDLAREAEVDVKTIREFVGGKERWPIRDSRAKIATALRWPADELDHIARTGRLSPAADDDATPFDDDARRPAHHLTDDELLSELTYRMRRYALHLREGGVDSEQGPTRTA